MWGKTSLEGKLSTLSTEFSTPLWISFVDSLVYITNIQSILKSLIYKDSDRI